MTTASQGQMRGAYACSHWLCCENDSDELIHLKVLTEEMLVLLVSQSDPLWGLNNSSAQFMKSLQRFQLTVS